MLILASLLYMVPLLAQESVLAKGTWYKLAVTKAGVYKVDGVFLKKAGLNLKQIKPENIRLFGNGGKMLPQSNAEKRINDLKENAIMLVGMEDGTFDSEDYLLFFGTSPHEINFQPDTKTFRHINNSYSDSTFYFLTFGNSPGLRIGTQKGGESSNRVESFDFFDFHEVDSKNIIGLSAGDLGGSGREWYGENIFSGMTQSFDLNTSGITSDGKFSLFSSVIGNSTTPFSLEIRLNKDSLVGIHTLKSIGSSTYDLKGLTDKRRFDISPAILERQNLSYAIRGENAQGFIDYFEWQFRRKIQFYEEQNIVYCTDCVESPDIKFQIDNQKSSDFIWDITEEYSPKTIVRNTENPSFFTIDTNFELKKLIFFQPIIC